MDVMLSGYSIYTADTPGVTWLQAQFALFLVFRSALSPNAICLRRENRNRTATENKNEDTNKADYMRAVFDSYHMLMKAFIQPMARATECAQAPFKD